MKVPKYIQDKMHKVARLNAMSRALMREVDDYFISKDYDIEKLRCGNGKSLDELDYGNDITDEFVKEADNDFRSGLWR